MGLPFFSVIIPAYNAADFVKETVAAVLRQTFGDFELIIVDDASTDSTPQILESVCNDPRIKLIFSEYNSGNPFKVRKIAAKAAKGSFIVPIDADDLVEQNLLDSLHETILQRNADLVLPEMWRFSESLKDAVRILPDDKINSGEIFSGRELVKHTLNGWDIPMAGFAVRRQIYLEAYQSVSEQESKSIHADEFLSRRILLLSDKVAFVISKYLYRVNPGSITGSTLRRIEGGLTTNSDLLNFCIAEFGVNSEEYKLALTQKALFLLSCLNSVNSSDIPDADRKRLLAEITAGKSSLDLCPISDRISLPYRIAFKLPAGMDAVAMKLIAAVKRITDR